MYAVVNYECKENGDRKIVNIKQYNCIDKAREVMLSDVAEFRNNLKDAYILHDVEYDDQCRIDVRGGYNEFYTWEIAEIESEEDDVEDIENDRIVEQQELEDFEQADEYFGSASDVLGADF